MNKMMKMTGWIVMVAALAMTFSACSNDNNEIDEPIQPKGTITTMYMTVGAGIRNEITPRAMVDDSQMDVNGKPLRTLKFTEGDQLDVRYNGEIEVNGIMYGYNVYGTLAISNIGADGLTAQFSGDLTINKWFAYPGEGEIPDPDLSQLDGYAMLIPADHGSSLVREEFPDDPRGEGYYQYNYHNGFTATETLNEVIARHSLVEGEIDASQNVTLTAKSCILNCTVTGLKASTAYDVRMAKDADPVSITTDGDGNLKFVFWTRVMNESMGFAFYIGNNKRMLTGEKTLTAGKVYNVTRAAVDFTPLTVTDNVTGNTVEPMKGDYYGFKDAADITVTGVGEGETISLFASDNIVTLNDVTSTSYNMFIVSSGEDGGTLNIVLSGTNSITITDPDGGIAIDAFGNNLKLSGNGTLTVTVYRNDYYGLMGNNYAYYGGDPASTNGDASVLAADGYTVTRSARTDNADGTHTWTYTVEQDNQTL